jgi:hypothetical protein
MYPIERVILVFYRAIRHEGNAETITRRVLQVLPDPDIPFCSCHRSMAERQLYLLYRGSARVRQSRKRAAEVVRCDRDTYIDPVARDDFVHGLCADMVAVDPSRLIDSTENVSTRNTRSGHPRVDQLLGPARHWNRPDSDHVCPECRGVPSAQNAAESTRL